MLLFLKDKRANPGSLSKSSAFSDVGERWVGKCFHFVFQPVIKKTSALISEPLNPRTSKDFEELET
jgi:hypothetical protein